MGLAGNREKQRISQDPNNLFWSKDESKFGFKMLQKMGWAPGKGLGVNEDGKQEHVKIRLKDNNLGVGATKKSINNWLGNTDAFSRLLADLNSQTNSEASSVNGDSDKEEQTTVEEVVVVEQENKEKKSKKDKKKKKEKKEKKEKKKSKKRDRDDKEEEDDRKSKKSKKDKKKKKEEKAAVTQPVVLRNAARAKFLRAKKMASTGDQTRLNEILGIKAEKTTVVETSEISFMPSFSV